MLSAVAPSYHATAAVQAKPGRPSVVTSQCLTDFHDYTYRGWGYDRYGGVIQLNSSWQGNSSYPYNVVNYMSQTKGLSGTQIHNLIYGATRTAYGAVGPGRSGRYYTYYYYNNQSAGWGWYGYTDDLWCGSTVFFQIERHP